MSELRESFEYVGTGGRHFLLGEEQDVLNRLAQLKHTYPGPYDGHTESFIKLGDGNARATFRWHSCE